MATKIRRLNRAGNLRANGHSTGNGVVIPMLPDALVPFSDVLHRIALTVNSSLELKETLKTLGDIALDAIPADRCHLFLLDETGGRLIPTFSAGRVSDIKLWNRFKTMEPIDLRGVPSRWEAFTAGHALAIPDMKASPLIPNEVVDVFGSRAAIVVPLKAAGEPLGVLSFDWVTSGRGFNFEEVGLAEMIGAYAALAIRNARLYEKLASKSIALERLVADQAAAAIGRAQLHKELQQRLQRVEVLSRLSDVVAGTSGLTMAVRRLNKFLRPELDLKLQSISITNPQVREAVGARPPGPEEMEAIRSWRASLARSRTHPKPRQISGALLVPVVNGNRVQGALRVSSVGPAPVEEELLAAIAAGCAEVIYKAGLRRDLADTERRLAIAAERDRIARDLHDSVGQILHGMGLRLAEYVDEAPGQLWQDRLRNLLELADRGNVQVRESIRALLFLDVRRKGLARAIRDLAIKFQANTGIDVSVRLEGEPVTIPAEYEDAFFRVVHESLMNVERHARAVFVVIVLTYGEDEVSMTVNDDGTGLAHRDPFGAEGPHFGLRAMQKMVSALGGQLMVRNADPRGVIVRARISIPRNTRFRREPNGDGDGNGKST